MPLILAIGTVVLVHKLRRRVYSICVGIQLVELPSDCQLASAHIFRERAVATGDHAALECRMETHEKLLALLGDAA